MGLKHLREQNKDFNINIIDLISKLDPTKTNKLTPFLVSVMKKKLDQPFEPYFGNDWGSLKNIFNEIDSGLHKLLLYIVTDHCFGIDNISQIKKFSDYLERGLIEDNDILKYKDFNQINRELSKAITKELINNSKKEVLTVYEDDEWWMFKPLTYETSVVYGYGTKWCTSMKNDPHYFYNHSDGILIYVINKKNNRKFGCHKHFGEPVRIYDEPDQQIDSFETGMDTKILKELFKLMNDHRPNSSFFSEEEKLKRDTIFSPKIRRIGPPETQDGYLGEEPAQEEIMSYRDMTIEQPSLNYDPIPTEHDRIREVVRRTINNGNYPT